MQTEFKHDIAAYLATRVVVDAGLAQPRSLADLIAFNEAHAEQELALFGRSSLSGRKRAGRWMGRCTWKRWLRDGDLRRLKGWMRCWTSMVWTR